MNVVYGVSGEGLGHVFEALEIIPLLLRQGHRVKVLTYGDRACDLLAEFDPLRIEGLPLYFNRKGLSLLKTTVKNRHFIPFYLKNWRRLKRELTAFLPDVFLTAYEPYTTLIAHVLRQPLISMDNQNELIYRKRPAGANSFDFRVAKWATRVCTFRATHYIVKSFVKPEPVAKHVTFVSPIIQNEIRNLCPTAEGPVLVYLTKPNPQLIEILRSIGERFVVYCNGPVGDEGNLSFRATGPAYLHDLCTCKAVIGTTGFSLIADAMFLRKPYFGVPLKRQFEQINNARFLRTSGFGEYSENVSRQDLERFLAELPQYRERLADHPFDPAEQEETLKGLLGKIERAKARPADLVTSASP